MSALAKKLARLRGEAGVAPICPSGIFPRAAGEERGRPAILPPARNPFPRQAGEVPAQRGMGALPRDPFKTAPAKDAHQATIDHLRSLLKLRTAAPPPAPRSLDRALPGEEIAPGLHLYEQWTPWPAGEDTLPLSGIRQDAVARSHVLAFDTETTGLAGGTGTRAFMIGAADWRDGGLRIRQLCITRLAAEEAMLRAFARWVDGDTILVSYNGKSYDRPLLSTRYRLARQPDPLPELRHVDLLHPVRRRYRGVWANCRLATVERELLGVLREDDLPGSEAPGAWRAYLRGGSASKLRRVGLHNAQDLRSLCGLLEAAARWS